MARGAATGHSAASGPIPRAQRPRIQALLWGGRAGCKPVFLDELKPRIAAYQNGGPALAIDPEAQLPPGMVYLGKYDLVEPLGPETPVYVARD